MKWSDRLLLNLAPPLASVVIRLLHATMRTEILEEEIPRALWSRKEASILAFWHDQLLLMVKGYRGPGASILISSSKDGELISRTMGRFGMTAVRGSSSRGGVGALREMVRLAKVAEDLVITPDGPRGPRHEVKPGVIQLARLTGRPVIPMAFVASRGHRFKSWDRFLLPYPFSRGIFSFGEPLRFSGDEDLDSCCRRLESALKENMARAAARLEEFGVSAV